MLGAGCWAVAAWCVAACMRMCARDDARAIAIARLLRMLLTSRSHSLDLPPAADAPRSEAIDDPRECRRRGAAAERQAPRC
eukprot:scaffold3952_cov116-Isochrysis_galbana.AAC.7